MREAKFKQKPIADKTKLRGGYYTPVELARYLTTWAIRDGSERVLEPSCGDGNIVVAALGRLAELNSPSKKLEPRLTAVELLETEIEKAQARAAPYIFPGLKTEWICQDFFKIYDTLHRHEKFDAIVGNPPFIRFQYFEAESRDRAFLSLRNIDYNPNKLANAWAAFVQLSVELLVEGGRLAMVVPAELLQVGYASELRARLASQFDDVTIVGFQKLVFPEIQQEVVLLLAEGKRSELHELGRLHTLEYRDGADLPSEHRFVDAVSHAPAKFTRTGMKWTSLFLSDSDFAALSEIEANTELQRLGDEARVEVGVVTGRNSFFLLREDQLKKLGASKHITNVVGRTNALQSVLFTEEDFEKYAVDNPAFMLNLSGIQTKSIPKALKRYIEEGEEDGVHQGYKCRIRKRWYDVPSIYQPDGFMYRQIHNFPMVVANKIGATSTDTIHRVRVLGDVPIESIAFRCFNSLSFAWAEVCGRSYGGGVLELEPREAEAIPLPGGKISDDQVRELDRLLRLGEQMEALDFADDILLRKGLGLSKTEMKRVRSAWQTLRNRRVHRS